MIRGKLFIFSYLLSLITRKVGFRLTFAFYVFTFAFFGYLCVWFGILNFTFLTIAGVEAAHAGMLYCRDSADLCGVR